METVTDFIFCGSKITLDGDCRHEITRRLLLGRKAMTKLVQFSSVTQSCPTHCDPMTHSTPGLPVHHQLLEFTQTHAHRVSDAIQLSHPLFSPSPPVPNPSQHQGLFQWINSSHQVAKYWSFSISISPSSEHPVLLSFRMDWLDLPAVQGTLKSLLQHHSLKPSIFWCSAFLTVQLSHPYMTTGKTIALTRRTFVDKARQHIKKQRHHFTDKDPNSQSYGFSSAAAAKSLQSCLTPCDPIRQPTRLPRPWDSSGKNTGVSCHFLLQCVKVKSESEVVQLCPTLSDPMDCSLPGSSIHGIFQARAGCHCLFCVFPVLMYRCESWTIKKVEHQRIDAF